MILLYFQRFSTKLKNPFAARILTGIFLLLLTLSYGCQPKAQQEVQLDITSVQPTGSNGVYSLEGSTNLPDSSQIAVSAVRYLLPTTGLQQNLAQDEGNINRSILARQIVEVEQGRWQADLDLWDIAPDGKYQEVWQAKQSQMKLRPDSNVAFIVTFDPAAQLSTTKIQLEGKQLRFTNEGEVYVSASQSFSVPLPEGRTNPPQKSVDLNEDLDKQILSPVSTPKVPFVSSAKFKQTNAPLKTLEFMR